SDWFPSLLSPLPMLLPSFFFFFFFTHPPTTEIYTLSLHDALPILSGPLLDRIDLHVEVPGVSAADLTLPPPAEGSAEVGRRVAAAREVQARRYNGNGVRTNAEADGELLDSIATPDDPGRKLLADAAAAMRLSARGFHRVMRV